MTLRVSTSGLHAQGLAALLRHQSQIARTQQQLTTGTRITHVEEFSDEADARAAAG